VRRLSYQWLKTNKVMLVNTGSLVGTTTVTSALGFVYWWLTTRLFLPEAVGLASAAISAMTLLATGCVLGLGTLLVGELPRQQGKAMSLISAALIVVAGVGGFFGIAFAIAAPFVSAGFQPLRASFQDVALFAAGVSLTAITIVLDQALIGLLRGELQLWRNILFSVAKLAVLFLVGLWLWHDVGMAIYASWAIGNALSLGVLAAFAMVKRRQSGTAWLPEWGLLRKLGPAALQHHVLNLVLKMPTLALPVLVTILLSATMNAWFYVAFMIANFVYSIPYALTTVLYATNSAEPAALAQKTRLTLGLSVATNVLACFVLLFGATLVLSLFGASYAEQAAWSLRILALGAFPLIIKDHYVVLCRIYSKIGWAILPIAIGGFFELGIAALGARLGGLPGLSLGWIIALFVEAVYMSRIVYKAVHSIEAGTSTNKEHQPLPSYYGTHGTDVYANESGSGQ
jgi:O-antigen/teichoic acid export membrane protein